MPTTLAYNSASQLASLTFNPAGATYDTSTSLAYNPAGQIRQRAGSNDAYAWSGHVDVNRLYTANGLNQYTAAGAASLAYDPNGNLTSSTAPGQNGTLVTTSYVYDVENRMVGRSGPGSNTNLRYDPLGRLYEVADSTMGVTRFAYDGDDLVAEYNAAGALLRRYVHGSSAGDDPMVWFEGSGVTNAERRYLLADERGSIVAVTNISGAISAINTYDEYGIVGGSSGNDIATRGRFRYTGQAWLPELELYYYKARMYSPTLGRFMQTDPIGYGDGMNMYNYVGGDPINGVDPTGLSCSDPSHDTEEACNGGGETWSVGKLIEVFGKKDTVVDSGPGWFGGIPYSGVGVYYGIVGGVPTELTVVAPQSDDIVVTAKKAAKKVGQCIAAQYGFGDGTVSAGLNIGKIASELGGIPLYKPWVGVPLAGGKGVSRFTNPISYIPFRLGIRANTGSQILGSGRVFAVLGRLNAPVATALFAYDAVSIAVCSASD